MFSRSSINISQNANTSSSNVQEEICTESVKAEGRSDGRSAKKEQKGKNGSVGRTFGVGATMLMMSQSRSDSVSSGSWEWHSVRSESSADVGQDSDDDLNIADNDMEMFDVMAETAGNETQNNTAAVNRLVDSHGDSDSVSLVSSIFEYGSEHESSEASSEFKYPPLDRLMRRKGGNNFGSSREGSCHVTGRKRLQNKVISGISGDNSTSLQSVDKVPGFMEDGNNSMKAPASKQSWLLEHDSGACMY